MLCILKKADDESVERLFLLYSESMKDLEAQFSGPVEMKAAYKAFLEDFISQPNQLVLAEQVGQRWVSGLRAIETEAGQWFLEAVETMPEARNKGYGTALLRHTISHLQTLNMKGVTCTIAQKNVASQRLHEKCGFVPTGEAPINCWGELEAGKILFRFCP